MALKPNEFSRYVDRLIRTGLPTEAIASDLATQFGDDALPLLVSAYEYVVQPFKHSEYARCQNCQKVWALNSLVELSKVKNLLDRVSPGEIVPAGECPDCGALCQLKA